MSDKAEAAGPARDDYDDEVLNAGWLPQPETVAPEPEAHPPVSSPAAREDADAFLQAIYRAQR